MCLSKSTTSLIPLCKHPVRTPDSIVQRYWGDDSPLAVQEFAHSLGKHEAHYRTENITLTDSLLCHFELNLHSHMELDKSFFLKRLVLLQMIGYSVYIILAVLQMFL